MAAGCNKKECPINQRRLLPNGTYERAYRCYLCPDPWWEAPALVLLFVVMAAALVPIVLILGPLLILMHRLEKPSTLSPEEFQEINRQAMFKYNPDQFVANWHRPGDPEIKA